MKKKLFRMTAALLICAALLCLTPGCSKKANSGTIKLKISVLENEEHGQGVLIKTFKDKVEELSGGTISVDTFFNGSLYTQDSAIPALRSGELEMTTVSIQLTAEYLPSIAMLASDYMFADYDHMRKVMDSEIGSELADKVKEAAGYYPLGYYYNGSRQLNLRTEKPINTPADLNGVILRMANAQSWIEAGEALGASVTPLAYNEVYTALSTGTIDAQDNPLPATKSMKFYEVTKQLCLTHHIIDFGLLSINNDVWNGLTEQQQGWLMEAADVAIKACDETQLTAESELVQFFKDEGLLVTEPNIDAFMEYAHNYYTDNGLTGTWDMDLYEKIQEAK